MKFATFADQGMMNHKKPEFALCFPPGTTQQQTVPALHRSEGKISIKCVVLFASCNFYYSNSCINSEKHNCWTEIVNRMY